MGDTQLAVDSSYIDILILCPSIDNEPPPPIPHLIK